MEKIDWKRKLSSRKFWLAVVGWVTNVLALFKFPESESTQIGAVIMSTGVVMAYIFTEGWIDSKNNDYILVDGEDPEDDTNE